MDLEYVPGTGRPEVKDHRGNRQNRCNLDATTLERVMDSLISRAPFSVDPDAGDLTDVLPLSGIQNLRHFAFVW